MAAQVAWGVVQHYRALCRLFLAGDNNRLLRLKEGAAGKARSCKHFLIPVNPAGSVDPYFVRQLSRWREEVLICLFYGEDGTFRAEQRRGGGLPPMLPNTARLIVVGLQGQRPIVQHDPRTGCDAPEHTRGRPRPPVSRTASR